MELMEKKLESVKENPIEFEYNPFSSFDIFLKNILCYDDELDYIFDEFEDYETNEMEKYKKDHPIEYESAIEELYKQYLNTLQKFKNLPDPFFIFTTYCGMVLSEQFINQITSLEWSLENQYKDGVMKWDGKVFIKREFDGNIVKTKVRKEDIDWEKTILQTILPSGSNGQVISLNERADIPFIFNNLSIV